MVDLSSLNPNQLESVRWNDGPLVVLAGPGSGKTRVLTYRIARIIEETADKHFRILGLTFTNKAAAEMRNRIEYLVPNARERVLLTTFHSFCVGVLRQHGHHVGLRPDFTILSQQIDRESILDDAIEAARDLYPDISYRAEQLLPLITRLLDNCVPAADAAEYLAKAKVRGADLIGTIYTNYRDSMTKNNQLDFGGIIAETLELLESRPAVTRLISRVYTYVCVDEFQDTNLAQYRILCKIVNPRTRNLFVVADDDQIIYQWNGADPRRLHSLRQEFDMPVIQLPENFRCPPEVIDVANRLIRHNPSHSLEKALLVAHKESTERNVIRTKKFPTFGQEANWVAADIASRPLEVRRKCVVLARARRLLEEVLQSLTLHEVSGFIAIRKDEFISNPMVWLHSMLRLANARQDGEQLRRVCRSYFDLEGVRLNALDIMSNSAAEEGDYLRAWQRAALQRSQLGTPTNGFLADSVPKLADRLDFWNFIQDSFAWFDDLPEIGPTLEPDVNEYLQERDTWKELVGEVVAEVGRPQATLNVLLQGLDLRSKAPNAPEDAVPCFTIHASKGLEFDHVYMIGMVEDELPSWRAIKRGSESSQMQEERRSCFVAVTRVQESLTLTYSDKSRGWAKRPSRFLREMNLLN